MSGYDLENVLEELETMYGCKKERKDNMMKMTQIGGTSTGKVYNTNLLTCDPYCFNTSLDFSKIEWDVKQTKIVDINVIVQNKVVECTFADGTKEKSVCREPDTFSMERAISICISKHIIGGSSQYNNAVKAGMKVYSDKLKKEANEKAELERIEKKRAKRIAYKERRAKRLAEEETARLQAEREEIIEIQKEAYIRAMEVLNG